uniref:TMV resistance protein N-like isoform X2 n=1 Tax=Fragaria vesca subsp. vesca TaxID=101020 RepID=UPI0005C857CB|nr:PREDICTED: TMV resistance protein N-like isoform X2 [Fragaria vesca subsp. vesca]
MAVADVWIPRLENGGEPNYVNSDLFTIKVYHGGHYDHIEKKYIGGSISYYDDVDKDKMSLTEVDGMMMGINRSYADALMMCCCVPRVRLVILYLDHRYLDPKRFMYEACIPSIGFSQAGSSGEKSSPSFSQSYQTSFSSNFPMASSSSTQVRANVGSSLPWKYDVFLSMEGAGTRKGFTDNLYRELQRRGIMTFWYDPEFERGTAIYPERLLTAIEQSRFAIVVVSPNYATSTWCLLELSKILECMAERGAILPIFYEVEPSHVRHQRGSFAEAFEQHEEKFWEDNKEVEGWRDALTKVAYLAGWSSKDYRYETELIKDIVQVLWSRVHPSLTVFESSEKLVGMDTKLEEIDVLLDKEANDVRFIGIWGMGGLGKTTLARLVYEKISYQFEVCIFLANVREVSTTQGLVRLQKQILSQMLKEENVQVWDVYSGIAMIKRCFYDKVVLLVLDDVDQSEQLQTLVGERDWFGSRSRIIITTRDRHFLDTHGLEKLYELKTLNENEAVELFCWKAFRKNQPEEGYAEYSKSFVRYAGGLPIALKILGSFLYKRSAHSWSSALQKLQQTPNRTVFEILRISFDGLDEMEKKIFLDISCFHRLYNNKSMIELAYSSKCCTRITIDVLVEKSLLTISSDNEIGIHDLIRDMGCEIVRQESYEDPGRRSRLWLWNDIFHVFTKNTGTLAIEGILLHLDRLEEADWNLEAFSKMCKLRLLCVDNLRLLLGPKYLPNALRILYWSSYPSKSLPPGFQPDELTELSLVHSDIDHLWDGITYLPNLKFINLSYSRKLIRSPDFTYAPRVERLVLEGCSSLVDIHPSIAHLESLTCLNLKDCKSLRSLPSVIAMKSLEIFILSGCSKFQGIPEFVGSMECLLELSLDETAIEQLPLSVGLLTGLTSLNLRDCKNLKRLPRDIGNLKSLKRLNICGCSKLETLPDSLGKIDCLEELDAAGGSSISNIPFSISLLENLEVLSLCGCKGISGNMAMYPLRFLSHKSYSDGLHSLTDLNLSDCNLQEGSIPEDFGCLFPLVSLNLSKNNFFSLPKSIRQLLKLRNLNLESCKTLQKLPDLSSSLNFSLGAESRISQERLSSSFNLINCSKLVVNQQCNNIALKMLCRFLQGIPSAGKRFETLIPGCEISELFSDQSVGPVISMELPQRWHNNKWMGYAFCACLVIRRCLPVPANQLGKWKFGTHNSANGLRCEVKPENLGAIGWCPSFVCSQELGQIESEHLWLSFVSGDYFGTAWQETCRSIEFTFKTLGTGMEVKKCGVRLIYEQDLHLIGMKR